MTDKLREAAQYAIDAMEFRMSKDGHSLIMLEAVEQLKAALSSKPESVAAVPDDGQAVFEEWLADVRPSGDVTAVHEQWLASSEYADWLDAKPAPAREPLTLDQLSDILPGTVRGAWSDAISIARAVEAFHNIRPVKP